MMLGVALACPTAGNLCGLFGVFITGPLGAAAAILLAAMAITAKRNPDLTAGAEVGLGRKQEP